MNGGNVAAVGVTATSLVSVAAGRESAPGTSRWSQWRRKKEAAGLRSRYFHLSPAAADKLDRALQRTGLGIAAFVERAAEREVSERLPDAPWARHIPIEYRDEDVLGSLLQYGLEAAAVHAEALKAEAARVARQHRGDGARITEARGRADLACSWLTFIEALDGDQGLREWVFRRDGGRAVRHRFKASTSGATPDRVPPA